jgi:hypothetical protein
MPLIGGSGGRGYYKIGWNAGAGGGAILVASPTSIAIGGEVWARGGDGYSPAGGGSGGGIRLRSPNVSVAQAGEVKATKGAGGCDIAYPSDGRIRIECEAGGQQLDGTISPAPVVEYSPSVLLPGSDAPVLRAALVNNVPVPDDPFARMLTPDVEIWESNPITVHVDGFNIPVGASVKLRVVPIRADPFTVTGTLSDAGGGLVTADLSVTFPSGPSEVQLRATW